MKLIGTPTISKEKIEGSLPEVVHTIFSIFREDPTIQILNEIKDLEKKLDSLSKKIQKQEALLSQAAQLSDEINNKIHVLEQQNDETRERLIEELGGTL